MRWSAGMTSSAFGSSCGQLRVEGRPITAIAISPPNDGDADDAVRSAPDGARQVALGATTRDDLDVIGDEVTVTAQRSLGRPTMVGTAVLPAIGSYSGATRRGWARGRSAPRRRSPMGPRVHAYGVAWI